MEDLQTHHSELLVPEASAGTRLDLFVGQALGLSRAKLKALFESGGVRVDGRPAKKGVMLRAGQRVSVEVGEQDPRPVAQPELPLTVLHQDDALVFVDKPANWPSHPLKPAETGCVANALVARYPECIDASEDPREAGLCHRLDVQTSGVLLAARSREAWTQMRQAFTGREVDKVYWALVTGPIADDGEIELPLRHRGADRVEAAADGIDAREALTRFRVLDRQGEYSLVEARILTGVLHQVRAHLASIGAPLVGDAQYDGVPLEGLERFFLHARSLEVTNPSSGSRLLVSAPLPADLVAALERIDMRRPDA